MRGTNFPDAEPRAPRRGGSKRGPRWGARVGACARPPAGRSGRLLLCPQPQASATGICALPVGSPRTQGASTAPTRGPKAPREQILGQNRAPTRGAPQPPKPWPETWNAGPDSAALLPHRCLRPSSRAHSDTMRIRREPRSPLRQAESGRPFPAPPPPAPPGPRPEGEQLNYEKSEGRKSQAPRRPPTLLWSPSPSPRPHPQLPQLGGGGAGGGGARGPAPLRQNKARRGSPRPRTEPVTKAGGRRRAPRPRSAGGGREGGLEGGVRCAPAVPGLRHLAALSPVPG